MFFLWETWKKTFYRNHLCVTNILSPKETHFIWRFSKENQRIEVTDGKEREEGKKQCSFHPTTGYPRDLVQIVLGLSSDLHFVQNHLMPHFGNALTTELQVLMGCSIILKLFHHENNNANGHRARKSQSDLEVF